MLVGFSNWTLLEQALVEGRSVLLHFNFTTSVLSAHSTNTIVPNTFTIVQVLKLLLCTNLFFFAIIIFYVIAVVTDMSSSSCFTTSIATTVWWSALLFCLSFFFIVIISFIVFLLLLIFLLLLALLTLRYCAIYSPLSLFEFLMIWLKKMICDDAATWQQQLVSVAMPWISLNVLRPYQQ